MKDYQFKLDKIRSYAKLLDSQFTFPGTKFKFGIDPLMSLIPGIGTFSGLLTGFVLVIMASRHGISGEVRILMIRNILIDYVWGLIPILGNIKDFINKSNEKNIALLEEHWRDGKYPGTGMKLILAIGLVLLLLTSISIIAMIYTAKLIINLFEILK